MKIGELSEQNLPAFHSCGEQHPEDYRGCKKYLDNEKGLLGLSELNIHNSL